MAVDEIARHLGVSPRTVGARKGPRDHGHVRPGLVRAAEVDVADLADAVDLKLGLERDMQEALRQNINQLDPTLRIVDDGKERHVEAGRIDILAEDDQGTLVAIELKSGEAPERAITQVLSYIGSLQAEDSSRTVLGMLIARGFSTQVRLAAQAAGIQLVTYGYSFTFTLCQ